MVANAAEEIDDEVSSGAAPVDSKATTTKKALLFPTFSRERRRKVVARVKDIVRRNYIGAYMDLLFLAIPVPLLALLLRDCLRTALYHPPPPPGHLGVW